MKAITLWQPWASLVAAGVKPYEFRRYPAPDCIVGQRIAIHAGARPMRGQELDALLRALQEKDGWGTALKPEAIDLLSRAKRHPDLVPLSAIVCTAIVGRPEWAQEIVARVYAQSFRGDSSRVDHQIFGWPMLEVEPVRPPIPARGAQGFWNWTR